MRIIAKISIILFALAMLPIAEIIWNTDAMNPFYIKEMLVISLIILSMGFLLVCIFTRFKNVWNIWKFINYFTNGFIIF